MYVHSTVLTFLVTCMYSLLKILTCLLIQWCIFYIRKVGRFLSPPPPPPNNKAAARPSLLLWRIFHHLLQELEEIYIDTSNTVNIAMESHALMLLTKVRKTTLAQSKWDNSVITVRMRSFNVMSNLADSADCLPSDLLISILITSPLDIWSGWI